jgi:hypothetical protein
MQRRESAMIAPNQPPDGEIGKLFAELREIYARAREGVSEPATRQVALHVCEESAKAAEVIKRIRELQGL